jgi:hypothetical protein
MWKYEPFKDFLNELLEHENVGEVILIDNDPLKTPLRLPSSNKLNYKTFGTNIYVNPSWNWGVENAQYDNVCILNDDMKFDLNVLEDLKVILNDPNTGVCGIIPGIEGYSQPPVTDGNYEVVPWTPGIHQFGYGCLMFVNKNNWVHIPEEIKIYYGDYFIFDTFLSTGKTNYCIINMKHETPYAQTTGVFHIEDAENMASLQEKEGQIYESIKQNMWKEQKPMTEQIVEMPREKTILIAIPTNKNIEAATFKSIFDLKVPKGYKTHFQYFYGYQIDQIRNLIAEWGKNHDYLFCVDSDIVLPDDTLLKMVGWDRDVVSGLYIQRIPGTHTIEIYEENGYGGVSNIPWDNIKDHIGIKEIAACGFGCVLIKSEVLRAMEYPHFVYRSALDHAHTFSEDVYFCQKAREAGFKIWADTTILCEHVGSFSFKVQDERPKSTVEPVKDAEQLPEEKEIHKSYGPKQAVVIRTYDDALSASYADVAEQSCRNVGLEVVRWNGFNKNHHTIESLSNALGIKFGQMNLGAACASASHYGAWQYIASLTTNDPVVVLEHDALMLHSIKAANPVFWGDSIMALGYKVDDPTKYDYNAAGAPNQIVSRVRHSGAHAYMITPDTAKALLRELAKRGSPGAIDNLYFMREFESDIPLSIMIPTPAIAWLRKSTIWDTPSSLNYDVHESFSSYHSQ